MPDGRISIAIVDDEVIVAAALMHILEGIGYVVTALAHTFEDGMALIDRLGERGLIFIDLFLNGRPAGIELAQRAAENGLNVVVMTGAAALPSKLPGAGLLLKPFSPEQVRTLLHTLREGPSAARRGVPATRHRWSPR
jgi:CheY-like chemotaxis protein